MVRSANLVGQSIIAYLQQKGYPEVRVQPRSITNLTLYMLYALYNGVCVCRLLCILLKMRGLVLHLHSSVATLR